MRRLAEPEQMTEHTEMKKTGFLLSIVLAAACASPLRGEHLVLLHTNDTHSLIEPDREGRGGVIARKAIFDSVRRADKNVLLIDAGDAVQGSLYFKFFHGDVEYPVMNLLGYDIRVLGNHEFDNGLDDLAKYWKNVKGTSLSANYDFSGTPLKGMFEPYVIKKVDGKKIGFIGLNTDPESLIAANNYKGMKFRDIISTANETASFLKEKKKCDLVVAVTHIGYENENGRTGDVELAKASRDIDIIIGGHSHTLVDPANPGDTPCLVDNAAGRPVLITQTGKSGKFIGEIDIDLDDLKEGADAYKYKLIPVTQRFPESAVDKRIANFLKPWKAKVDSVNSRVIAYSQKTMDNNTRVGSFPNWTADFAADFGRQVMDSLRAAGQNPGTLDGAVMNVGGIRSSMPEGDVTEGEILSIFPFSNRIVIMDIKGKDLVDALDVAARKGGESVSKEFLVLTNDDGSVRQVYLNGEPVDPEKNYKIATIDYLAWGNDDMRPLANAPWIWTDPNEMSVRVLDYVEDLGRAGIPVQGDSRDRFVKVRPLR